MRKFHRDPEQTEEFTAERAESGGFITSLQGRIEVLQGQWVVTKANGSQYVVGGAEFLREYTPIDKAAKEMIFGKTAKET